MIRIINDLDPVIRDEGKRAIEKFGIFANMREAHSVIEEEIDETWDAIEELNKSFYRFYEEGIRKDSVSTEHILDIRKAAVNLAAEAVQVAAMCNKIFLSNIMEVKDV